MRWPHRFSGLALVVGSMAPDLEFIGRMSDDWLFSHTLWAQLWFTAPTTVVLVWIITALLVPALLPYVREIQWLRLHDLAALDPPPDARAWRGVAVSGCIGGLSHVLLDGITHGNHSGWLVPWIPALRTPVPHLGGVVPLHDALQCWLTIAFAVATIMMWRRIAGDRLLWRWRSRVAVPARVMPRMQGMALAAATLVAAMQGAYAGRALSEGGSNKAVAAAISFGAVDFMVGLLCLAAIGLRWRRRYRVGQTSNSRSSHAHDDAPAPLPRSVAGNHRVHRRAA
jgi:hypothetical protein